MWALADENTGADVDAYVVDNLVFDVKVDLDIDFDFDVDFDVIEVMWDIEDDIVSLFFLPTDKSVSHSSWRHQWKMLCNLQTSSVNTWIHLD